MQTEDFKRSDFDYALPPELIAQAPLPQRSASRLLLLTAAAAARGTAGREAAGRGAWQDRQLRELPALLQPGDLLVLNDTRVLPARLALRKPTGGRIELLLERPLGGRRALVQLRDSRAVRAGMALQGPDGAVLQVIARQGEFWEVELPAETVTFFEQHGQVPLPPYIERAADEADRERYQSLWARVPGAVAAPTASLHFDAPLLAALQARGVERAFITLHVGAGTFQPVRTEQLRAHVMHAESYRVEPQTVALIERTRAAGRRVVAVGTTVARALEAAAGEAAAAAGTGPGADGGQVEGAARPVLMPAAGQTTLFIRPGYRFRVVDALLTNFHLPQSTLLMLVSALAGRELVLAAYEHAVRERYRFFSYGDAMLVLPQ
jgi:S-adenosylmethionine:tRNA ribosyltransferase-isomerase